MTTEPPRRKPLAFRLSEPERDEAVFADPGDEISRARSPRSIDDLSMVTIEPDDAIEREALDSLDPGPANPRKRRFSFAKLFFAALGVLVSLAIGLALDSLIRDLFARAEWLGWVALAVSALLLLGALGVVVREAVALSRLAAVDRERKEGLAAFEADSAQDARKVVDGLVSFLSAKPETAEGRARLEALKDEVIDGRDMIALAERELLLPLDRRARGLVMASAKRVSVVTAVSPKALVDVAFVLFETVRLIRRMSELYGARPGTIGLIRLTRDVLAHLAVTGSISVGDSLVQQVVGHGLAAKLSARLGEGVVNGLLTTRVGLAAMDLCRPLPFLRVKRPSIGDFLSDLTASVGERKALAKVRPEEDRPGR